MTTDLTPPPAETPPPDYDYRNTGWGQMMKDLVGIFIMFALGLLLLTMAYFALTTGQIQIKYDAYTYYDRSPVSFTLQVIAMFVFGVPLTGFSLYILFKAFRGKFCAR